MAVELGYAPDDHQWFTVLEDLMTNPASPYYGTRCLKRPVAAVIVSGDEVLGLGANLRDGTQMQLCCPREFEGCKSGEGYEFCAEVCGQVAHAEIAAMSDLKFPMPAEAEMFVWGHCYCCDQCVEAAMKIGIKSIWLPKSTVAELEKLTLKEKM